MADKNVKLKNSAGDYLYPATNLSLTQNKGTLPIEKGGTGKTTAAEARTALDVFSKSEVNNKIAAIDQFEYKIVTALPTASASTELTIYLIKDTASLTGSYVEYLTIKEGSTYKWEQIGTTSTDLSGYSKNTHKHTFTGKAKNVSVNGNYDKTTGVDINLALASSGATDANFQLQGDVTLSKKSGTTVNTTTVNSITGVGTLPSLTFGTESGTGKQPFIESLTKGSYTPSGTVTSTFTGTAASGSVSITPKGSVSLGANTTADGGVPYVEVVTHTPASGTSTAGFVTGINGGSGSLTSDATATNGIKYVESVTHSAASGIAKYMHWGAGSLPTSSAVTNIRTGGSTSTAAKLTGSVTNKTLTISAATSSAYLTGTGTTTVNSMTSAGSLPSLTFNATASGGEKYINDVSGGSVSATTKYLHHTHTGASASATKSAITSVSGGSISATTKYFHPSFTGTAGSGSFSITPSGSVTSTFKGTATSSLVTGGTTKYMTFAAGTLPTKGSNTTVATGIKADPVYEASFFGYPYVISATVKTASTSITSTGSYTPEGTLSQATN